MRKSLAIEEKIVEEMKALPSQHQKRVLDIVRLLKTSIREPYKKHNILELRGCGKKIWKGIDAQEYVNRLREEWN